MRPFAQLVLLALPLGCGNEATPPTGHGYVPASAVQAPRPVADVVAPRTFVDPAATAPAHDNPNGVDGARPAREP